MNRRTFTYLNALAGLSLAAPFYGCRPKETSLKENDEEKTDFDAMTSSLLTTWCEALIADQIDDPENPERDGALYCHACDKIHGRCIDAVYPFMYLAKKTGNKKYIEAAIKVIQWSKNVSMPDGSWTVIPYPSSWKGITVFGAIALGEALHHHGSFLPNEVRREWTARLNKAADFIHQNFTIDYSHVNYAFTAVYALAFLGRMFNNAEYLAHAKELAAEIPNWLTTPNKLIFGEDHPTDKRSAKGLLPVDLGYNVEETLNGLVQYAVMENDEKLLDLLEESMRGHLEFMLPDGAWDNSWGTRQNKWSYWGSRTTDGCQPAFALMAKRDPAFGAAAILNTELLQRCTVDGLLAGGLHYGSHGVKPCIHHSFAHAKSLAFLKDNAQEIEVLTKEKSLPRSLADGVRHFPELDVWLAGRATWRATVSSYDNVFKKEYSQQATGGSLAVLWHQKVGPLFTASMAGYILAEANNQQPQPGADFALTPRIERIVDGMVYTNIQDLKAKVKSSDVDGVIKFEVQTHLTNREKEILPHAKSYALEYIFDLEKTIIKATRAKAEANGDQLILPIISPTGEVVEQVDPFHIKIKKPDGVVILESNVPLEIRKTEKERIFNMVPGMEAVPIVARFRESDTAIECSLRVVERS